MGNSFSRWRAAGALGLGAAALAGYFALRTPEPARAALELVSVLCEVQGKDGKEAFERRVAESLELSSTDPGTSALEGKWSRDELLQQLNAFWQARPACSATLEEWRLSPGAGGLNWVEGVLQYSESQPGDLHAERRTVRGAFRESEGGVRLTRLIIGPTERHDPEARP